MNSYSEIMIDYSFRYRGNFLHYCCYSVHRNEIVLELINLCVKNNVPLNITDKPYRRLFTHYAAWRGMLDVFETLFTVRDSEGNPLLSDDDLLRSEDYFGWTILHWSSFRNNGELVTQILKNKGYLNWHQIKDKKGNTVLQLASNYRFFSLSDIIKKYIFEKIQENNDETSPASQSSQPESENTPTEPTNLQDSLQGDSEQRGRSTSRDDDELMNREIIQMLEEDHEKQNEEIALLRERERQRAEEINGLLLRIRELERAQE